MGITSSRFERAEDADEGGKETGEGGPPTGSGEKALDAAALADADELGEK